MYKYMIVYALAVEERVTFGNKIIHRVHVTPSMFTADDFDLIKTEIICAEGYERAALNKTVSVVILNILNVWS